MAEDSLTLMNIFTREIWMNIFDKFVEKRRYDDIQSTINSSQYFRDLTINKRTTLLFPKVFEVLGQRYDKPYSAYKPTRHFATAYREEERNLTKEEKSSQILDSNNDEESRSRLRRIPMTERIKNGKIYPSDQASVLKMRQICKIWYTTINRYREKQKCHYVMTQDCYEESKETEYFANSFCQPAFPEEKIYNDWSLEMFNCWEYEDSIRFLKHYESNQPLDEIQINPFIGRAIDISEGLELRSGSQDFIDGVLSRTDYQFYDAITTILDKYGMNIWFCKISIRDKLPSRVDYYRMIKNWLVLMPNLKVLKVDYQIRVLSGPEARDYITMLEVDQLKQEIRENPLPLFKTLSFLQTMQLPAPICNGLLKTNYKSLQMLEIDTYDFQHIEYDFSQIVQIPNLKQLSVKISTLAEIEKLNGMTTNWKLEKAYFDFFEVQPFICWSKLLKIIEKKWGNTLTNLMINFPISHLKINNLNLWKNLSPDNFNLVLPMIKRLKLVLWNDIPFDFLLAMKDTLEVFEFFNFYEFDDDEEDYGNNYNQLISCISRFGYDFYESNMWELFPKLKLVQYFGDDSSITDYLAEETYTRNEWETKYKFKGIDIL